jgi:DNA-binding Lrp family transcriptional regulator
MLDAFSQKILTLLQLDARRSVQEISEQVGLSSTPCWRRIKEMEQQGIIKRYTALLDREKLGLQLCALIHVQLNRQISDAAVQLESAVIGWPQVTECYRTAGEADYVLKLVAKDIATFDSFLQRTLLALPCVAQVRSSLVLNEVKFDTALPFPQ